MSIDYIDHVERGKERVVSYFKDKKEFLYLIEIFLTELQEIEDAFTSLSEMKNLSTVTGVWLDYLGKIVGELRLSRDDETYRAAIQLKIAINTSDGTAGDIYEIVKTYTQSDKVRIAEGILSYGQLIFNGTTNANRNLYDLVDEISPVTTKVIPLQDTDNKCFFPAWELTTAQIELFEVFDGITVEAFEVVPSEGATPTSLFLSATRIDGTYDLDTLGSEILEWEEAVPFRLNNGAFFEVVVSEGVVEQFYVNGLEEGFSGDTLLPWEITEDCFYKDDYSQDIQDLIDYYGDELQAVLDTLKPVIDNLPDYITD